MWLHQNRGMDTHQRGKHPLPEVAYHWYLRPVTMGKLPTLQSRSCKGTHSVAGSSKLILYGGSMAHEIAFYVSWHGSNKVSSFYKQAKVGAVCQVTKRVFSGSCTVSRALHTCVGLGMSTGYAYRRPTTNNTKPARQKRILRWCLHFHANCHA